MIIKAQIGGVREMRQELADTYAIVIDSPLPSMVPEPANWALLIAGSGLVGGAMRRRTDAVLARN